MIPKKIHYCWFGGNPKPEIINNCIASWHKLCPDWEIIEWNESNYDISSYPFMQQAYDAKKWAFVSDVARLDIIAKYGGVYLDTDVELLAPIDDLLASGAFYIFETERYINTGFGFGAEAGHPTVVAMLRYYEGRSFLIDGKPDLTPCPRNNTQMLLTVCPTLIRNGHHQEIQDVVFLSKVDYDLLMKHYATASWTDNPNLDMNKKPYVYKDTKWKRFLKQPEKFDFIEKHLGSKAVKVYTFLVYDLLDFGPLYYVKRIFRKFLKKH